MNQNERRIAIVGTYCSGKSTLSQRLASELSLPNSGNMFQMQMSKMFPGRKYTDLAHSDATALALNAIMQREDFENNNDSFVADASGISEHAYAIAAHEIVYGHFDSLPATLEQKFVQLYGRYTHIFYLPNDLPFTADEFRPNETELRDRADTAIPEILQRYDLPHHIIRGPLDLRVNMIKTFVQ